MYFIPIYILILFLTIIIDYVAGIMIERAEGKTKRWYLVLSVITNVGVLAFFKYYNFFIENVNEVFHLAHSQVQLHRLAMILPIGLSFHTFQAMSYTIEVYRENQKAEKHLGIYALYVMFYPQLVAGPIERPQNVLHQFHEVHHPSYENFASGLRQMLWGLFKKCVIADRLAMVVDQVYNVQSNQTTLNVLVACVFFAFQIYCDFSAYSDIALGAARTMGYELMVNFDLPFTSKSISEFWRRWHISLSTWFSDYLFNPMMGSFRNLGNLGIGLGLLITFMISGFWHGAGWNFVVFGSLHGAAVVYEFYTKKQRKKLFKKMPLWLNHGLSVFLTLYYAIFTWIFFRAHTMKDALSMVKKFFALVPDTIATLILRRSVDGYGITGITISDIVVGVLLIILLELLQKRMGPKGFSDYVQRQVPAMRWSVYVLAFFAIFFFGVFGSRQFIYFQF